MPSAIDCVIDASLKSNIQEFIFNKSITTHYIESNEDWVSHKYSLLILNLETHNLYSELRFRSELKFDAVGYYNKHYHRPEDIECACAALISTVKSPGVLSHDQIKSLMKIGILIYDGDYKRIESASYDLLLDKEHLKSGIKIDIQDTISIEPLDYVVVCAKESVNMPKNICGTFDLAVTMFCRGIILSNGPQVDPGYAGRLLCLLFNTSAKEFVMQQSQDFKFSTIQFQALSGISSKAYDGTFQRKRSVRDYIGKYADESISDRILSITAMQDENTKIRNEIISLNGQFSKFKLVEKLAIALTAIGIAIMLLAIFYAIDMRSEYFDVIKNNANMRSQLNIMESKFKELEQRLIDVEKNKSHPKPSKK